MLFGFLLFFMVVVGVIADAVKGRAPLQWLLKSPLEIIGIFGGLILVLGLCLFALSWICACSVESDALKGRNFWGRRKAIAWDDIGQIVSTRVEGMPALVVGSASSKKEIYVYVLGADLEKIHAALWQHAGPQHALTRLFRPN